MPAGRPATRGAFAVPRATLKDATVNVTDDYLFNQIGRLTVENQLLREQAAQKDKLVAALDAEVTRLRAAAEQVPPPEA